ncbi:hypothetical protein LCGC14_0539980 [marine sediment metagenome]|uniref:Uncharacterized protein n=1 Tax=marine sediment metagenome TaxID=412755 RepID=A0A0F9UEJ6_9ZZZZ
MPTNQESKDGLEDNTLRRKKPPVQKETSPASPSVSAGPVDKVIELAFNPSREKIREVTIIDRMQGRLFPQLDMINKGRMYCMEVATYRQDPEAYQEQFKRPRPVFPDLLDELMFRTAQWQKSVAGKNLERATDIALAETETRAGDDGDMSSGDRDAWKE